MSLFFPPCCYLFNIIWEVLFANCLYQQSPTFPFLWTGWWWPGEGLVLPKWWMRAHNSICTNGGHAHTSTHTHTPLVQMEFCTLFRSLAACADQGFGTPGLYYLLLSISISIQLNMKHRYRSTTFMVGLFLPNFNP